MANINIPPEKQKEYQALVAERDALTKQIVELKKEHDAFTKNVNSGAYNPANKKKTVNMPDTYAWDVVNDPAREPYDLRNYKNFRSNIDEKAREKKKESELSPNPNKSYYLRDICYAEHLDFGTNSKLNPDVQTIILNEFQPNATIQVGKLLSDLVNGAGGKVLDFVKSIGPTSIAGAVTKVLETVGGDIVQQKMLDYYSKHPSALYEGNLVRNSEQSAKLMFGETIGAGIGQLTKTMNLDPISQIRRMFHGGKWLNTYELPFFNNTYLETSQGGSWKNEGINQILGDGEGVMNTIAKKLKINFPTAPIYEITDVASSGYKQINFDFYLINKDAASLLNNYQFLNAFFSGTQWVSMLGGMVKCPNVYNVHVPGRFHIYWATMTCTITAEGKLTRVPLLCESIVFKGLNSVKNTNPLWPEAWKVSCSIKDLTPNNFNTYIDYLVNGWDRGIIASLEENTSLAGTVFKAANAIMEKGLGAVGDALASGITDDENSIRADNYMAEDQAIQADRAKINQRILELTRQRDEVVLKMAKVSGRRE